MGKYLIMIGGVFAFIGLCVMCCGGGVVLLLIAAAMIVIGFVVNDIQLKSELKKIVSVGRKIWKKITRYLFMSIA